MHGSHQDVELCQIQHPIMISIIFYKDLLQHLNLLIDIFTPLIEHYLAELEEANGEETLIVLLVIVEVWIVYALLYLGGQELGWYLTKINIVPHNFCEHHLDLVQFTL